jgi:DNA-binding transcriptional regulator YiaG
MKQHEQGPASDLDRLLWLRTLLESGLASRVRQGAGLSQSDLARAVRVTPATVCRWENRTRNPRGANALAYAEILERLMAR